MIFYLLLPTFSTDSSSSNLTSALELLESSKNNENSDDDEAYHPFKEAIPDRMECLYEYCRVNEEILNEVCFEYSEVIEKLYKKKFNLKLPLSEKTESYAYCIFTFSTEQYDLRKVPKTICSEKQGGIFFHYIQNTPVLSCLDSAYFGPKKIL